MSFQQATLLQDKMYVLLSPTLMFIYNYFVSGKYFLDYM